MKTIVCGTPGYIAPEAIAGKGCNLKSDVFSVGSILFNALTLKNLFNGNDYKTVMMRNKECEWDNLEYRLRVANADARDLVIQLLQKDPAKRPSAQHALKHKWFKKEKEPLEASINLNKILAEKNNPTLIELQSALQGSRIASLSPRNARKSVQISGLSGIGKNN